MINWSIRQLTYLLLVTSSIFVIISIYPSEQSYWVAWSGLTFALISLGNNFIQRLEAICVTALVCLFTVWMAEYANVSLITLAVFLFAVSAYLAFLAERYPAYAYPILIINLFAILASYHPSFVGGYWEKSGSVCLGVAIVLVCQLIFSYRFQQREWHLNLLSALNQLRKLNQEIFSCLLQPEYADNLYIFERRIHAQKERFMQSIVLLSTTKKTQLQTIITKKLNLLYDITLSYAQLRRRVSDYAVLGICMDEMKAIEKEVDQLFVVAQKGVSKNKYNFDVQPLLMAIQHLEDNYHQMLQVTSKEPLVFLLFIASLRSFAEEMTNLD